MVTKFCELAVSSPFSLILTIKSPGISQLDHQISLVPLTPDKPSALGIRYVNVQEYYVLDVTTQMKMLYAPFLSDLCFLCLILNRIK